MAANHRVRPKNRRFLQRGFFIAVDGEEFLLDSGFQNQKKKNKTKLGKRKSGQFERHDIPRVLETPFYFLLKIQKLSRYRWIFLSNKFHF